jgi:Protein of unknown function (DUF3102)
MTAKIIPVDPDNARTLARHATEIRRLGKQVVSDVIEIGRLLVESKELVGHGDWLPWLSREFQWSDTTAERFMRVHKLSLKNGNLPNLDIPLSGLYLLAAPSTPEVAKLEVTSRAEAGEPITLNTVKEIVGRAKQDDRRGARAETEPPRNAGKPTVTGPPMWAAVEDPPGHFSPGHSWLMDEISRVEDHLEDAARIMLNLKSGMGEFEMNKASNAFRDIATRASRCATILKPEGNPK